MFIGRERELASLKEFYDKDGIGMTVIYGRRRIGKSTLIAEFVKDKKTIFYTATKVGKTRNLELFSRQVVVSNFWGAVQFILTLDGFLCLCYSLTTMASTNFACKRSRTNLVDVAVVVPQDAL